MAEADPTLREKQPWKAAFERDYAWLGQVMVEHYAGDDTNVRTLLGGVLAAHGGISVDDFEDQAHTFLHSAQHPTLGRGYLAVRLRAHGRAAAIPRRESLLELHRVGQRPRLHAADQRGDLRDPRDRVIGSATALDYAADDSGGSIMRKAEADVLDDGPQKPIRIWSRIGRRPILAAGNSNGDIPMLDFTHHANRPRCAFSSSTTTASVSSPTRPVLRTRSSGQRRRGGQ